MDEIASAERGTALERWSGPRPSIPTMVLLAVGLWATVASTPPTESSSSTGEATLTADGSAVAISYVVTDAEAGEPVDELEHVVVSWQVESEHDIEPEVSLTTTPDNEVEWSDPDRREVQSRQFAGQVEISVLNLDESGPVDLTWVVSAKREGSDPIEVSVTAESMERPSSSVRLVGLRGSRVEDFAVATVVATIDEAPTGAIRVVQGQGSFPSGVVLDGQLLPARDGVVEVPWPAGCGDGCTTSFAMPLASSSDQVRIEAEEPTAAVGVVTRSAPRTTSTVRLPDGPYLSDERTVQVVEVEVPAAPANPLQGRVEIGVLLADADHPLADDLNCSTRVELATSSGVDRELTVNVWGDVLFGTSVALEAGSTNRLELWIGTDDPGQHCDLERDLIIPLELAVVTYGLEGVSPVEIRLI